MSNFDLSVLFFLQMAVILATCRVVMATPIFELVYGRRGRVMGLVGAVRTT